MNSRTSIALPWPLYNCLFVKKIFSCYTLQADSLRGESEKTGVASQPLSAAESTIQSTTIQQEPRNSLIRFSDDGHRLLHRNCFAV